MNKQVFKGYATGLMMGFLTVVGCASVGFPYRYYGTSMDNKCYDEGWLLGKEDPEGWPDMPLDQCKPDAEGTPNPVKLKCITLLVDDFYSLKGDNEKCHQDLQDCQAGNPPSVKSIIQPLSPGVM